MTNIQTKKELNDEYQNVKYILTSGMRTKLLLSLYEHSKKLEEIRNDLKKPSATILHGLKELENKNLIRKIQKNRLPNISNGNGVNDVKNIIFV